MINVGEYLEYRWEISLVPWEVILSTVGGGGDIMMHVGIPSFVI